MGISLSKLQEMVKDREAWHSFQSLGCKELDTTEGLKNKEYKSIKSRNEVVWRVILKEDYSPQASVSLLWGEEGEIFIHQLLSP